MLEREVRCPVARAVDDHDLADDPGLFEQLLAPLDEITDCQLFIGRRDDDRELWVGDVGLGKVNDESWIGAVDDPCTLACLHVSQGGAEVTVRGHADHAEAAQGLGRPRRRSLRAPSPPWPTTRPRSGSKRPESGYPRKRPHGSTRDGSPLRVGLMAEWLPIPPLEMRELVGCVDVGEWNNESGSPIWPNVPAANWRSYLDFGCGCGCGRGRRRLTQQKRDPNVTSASTSTPA